MKKFHLPIPEASIFDFPANFSSKATYYKMTSILRRRRCFEYSARFYRMTLNIFALRMGSKEMGKSSTGGGDSSGPVPREEVSLQFHIIMLISLYCWNSPGYHLAENVQN